MNAPTRALEQHLLESRQRLLAFIRTKISNPELAEDVLQESLLKALQAAPDLREKDKLVAWFHRIVRNAVMDVYRRRKRTSKYLEQYAREVEEHLEPQEEALLCACFQALIPTLKPEYAELIETVELGGMEPDAAAERLGITRNNLKVRRHRARQQLRQRVEETCRTCAEHGCLDCTCRG